MKIIKATTLKPKPAPDVLGFGNYFTDYMYIAEYAEGKGWHNAHIQPYADFSISPAAMIFHYGQGVFEGLKAYKNAAGEARLFRAADNFARLNESCARLCIPPIDGKAAMDALAELLKLERDWIPSAPGTSLYIRPTVFAVDECLSVHASKTYLFYIILSPVGSYYKNGLQPVRLLVEDAYCRACPGGTGATKYIGNYGASLKAGEAAERAGFDQVLWLDAAERKYVEEVGSMNIFFVLNGKVVTPALSGSVLNGITRRSVIELLNKSGRAAEERRVPIAEILSGAESGELSECFGTGTAAVVSPVGYLRSGKTDFSIGGGQIGPVSRFVYDTLTGIQTGATTDPFGWTTVI